MPNINVSVKNKIAVQTDWTRYICGNSDFTVVFDFDPEWQQFQTKTARFRYNGKHTDVIFTGNECQVPVITDTNDFEIGVFAGDLHTSTPAVVLCEKSILCGDGAPADPAPDIYAQIMEKLNNLDETDPTVPEWAKAETKPTYTAEEVGAATAEDVLQAVNAAQEATVAELQPMIDAKQDKGNYLTADTLQAATDAALAQAKESGQFDGPPGKDGVDGQPGEPGADGHTPEKGVDYWTEADRTEMIADVLAALPDGTEVAY